MLGIEPRTQSSTSALPLSHISCNPRDRHRCKQRAGELGVGEDPHTTQHTSWYLGTQGRRGQAPGSNTGVTKRNSRVPAGNRTAGSQAGYRRDKWSGHCRPFSLLQSLVLRERELDCVSETAPVITGKERKQTEEASRPTVSETAIPA